jgi:glycolate oxidase FAD binding subunit
MSDISQQLVEAVNSARAEGKPLNICGFGSKAFMGRKASGQPLSITGHSGIVSYQPVELVISVRAGTSLSEIQFALDEQGQMLSFEPPSFASEASIGGTLAANISGPARPWSGSIRDMVLGTRLINGRGEHLRFGGEVMKNVAGYDVSRLQAGAMGTLGVITEVSMKVLPRPAASITLVADIEANEAVLTMNQLAREPKPLSGACWMDGKLIVRLSGSRAAVEGTAAQWRGTALQQDEAERFWSDLANQRLSFFAGEQPLWRFSIKPTAAVVAPVKLPDVDWLLDWGGAQRWLRGDFDPAELEALAIAAGGQVALFRGGNRTGEVFHTMPAPMQALQRRVKASFDPDGLFNPGRLYSWL